MIKIIKVSGFEESVKKISGEEEKRKLLSESKNFFNKVVENERDDVLEWLIKKFIAVR